ncbi:hypothetical protein EmuJ_000356800 [Echinococcus multilocularis]|uniref:Uncharacterized protein n=1 Tax=Echinococcus multilocularis TaxID=6211 RepID=A0A068Y248_ECHMU|nr:hypothetical protein EmuJ_000356800 [Echinococcus multilocularis]
MQSCCEEKNARNRCVSGSSRGNRVNAGAVDGKTTKLRDSIHKQCTNEKKNVSRIVTSPKSSGSMAATKRTSIVITPTSTLEFLRSISGRVGLSGMNSTASGAPKALPKRPPPSSHPISPPYPQPRLRASTQAHKASKNSLACSVLHPLPQTILGNNKKVDSSSTHIKVSLGNSHITINTHQPRRAATANVTLTSHKFTHSSPHLDVPPERITAPWSPSLPDAASNYKTLCSHYNAFRPECRALPKTQKQRVTTLPVKRKANLTPQRAMTQTDTRQGNYEDEEGDYLLLAYICKQLEQSEPMPLASW